MPLPGMRKKDHQSVLGFLAPAIAPLHCKSRLCPVRSLSQSFKSPRMSVAATPSPSIVTLPNGTITTPRGFKAAGICAGFKESKNDDLAVVISESEDGATAAGTFTKSEVRAAPVDFSELVIIEGIKVRAVVINSGQANACCGKAGEDFVEKTARKVKDELGGGEVLLMSTGCIGETPDWGVMDKALPSCIRKATRDGGDQAAQAILTTDLVSKQVALERVIDGKSVRMAGMAKGSGMIHPNMATMLSLITCDADVDHVVWQTMLSEAVENSFNMITVDGDTSTNDTVYALASGASGLKITDTASPGASKLKEMLNETTVQLAKSVARDGEGATILLEVKVSGAKTTEDARKLAKSVTGSSLFKAAVYGRDPNWGRIAGAVGYAGVKLDVSQLSIDIGPFAVLRHGQPVDFDRSGASKYMADAAKGEYLSKGNTVVIDIGVGDGSGEAVAWGCDLTYKYVEINADYHT
eukprot:Plantae.Rhodophyta-Hildenbrandia_rubra.ctg6292.p2 GENE.Plantae.Rhodophyta-Hildenbrandia_rubra.ctg6292~~Plantae.Rhodophyta-Hildenbrandia_rubra.ctg6292.p2  ORF type:complete len:468 (-),score=84.28 Plantae.Rhodophyta-Hildenbrandia_rubra.ctg6292:590-1993(-)